MISCACGLKDIGYIPLNLVLYFLSLTQFRTIWGDIEEVIQVSITSFSPINSLLPHLHFFFGFLIGIISCYQGLKTSRGTEGVGNSTTLSVVICSVAVFVSDYFLTKVFLLF